MKTPFAPCELPPLLTDNQRYLFNTSIAAVTFCTGMRAMSFMDAGQDMVIRLSMDGRWAVDFELTPAQRFISDYVNEHIDVEVRDKFDNPVTKRVYQNQDRLVSEHIKPVCNRRFLPNASQSVLECLTASCAGLWERAAEVYAAAPEDRERIIKSIVRTATFKVLRWIPEKQGERTEDSEFSEPVESVDGYAPDRDSGESEKDFYEIEDFLITHIDRERQQKQPAPELPTEYEHMALRLGKADADWLWSYQTDAQMSHLRALNPRTAADRNRAMRLRSRL